MIELSRRQKQVLTLLAEGLTDAEIGLRLGISATPLILSPQRPQATTIARG
jgi:ATP/maltotriose-dependent transcriptional regulator MalT